MVHIGRGGCVVYKYYVKYIFKHVNLYVIINMTTHVLILITLLFVEYIYSTQFSQDRVLMYNKL